MKKTIAVVIALALALGIAVTIQAAKAAGTGKSILIAMKMAPAETAPAAAKTVKGVVTVVKEGDTVKAISVKPADGDAVAIVLDKAGKKLATMAGKTVTVTGALNDKKQLVVKPWFDQAVETKMLIKDDEKMIEVKGEGEEKKMLIKDDEKMIEVK